MPAEPDDTRPLAEADEKQLCVSCLYPNESAADFCAACGAPLSSYAATGPFELLFAEGHVYRQATERPKKFIVLLGVWIIFGSMAAVGSMLILLGRIGGLLPMLWGIFILPISIVIILRSTRNYFVRVREG